MNRFHIGGPLFLCLMGIPRLAHAEGDKAFLVIVGGISPVKLSPRHEKYAQIFNSLFGGKATTLFGEGPATQLLTDDQNGCLARDESGALQLSPTTLAATIRPATLDSVKMAFDEQVARNPASLTVFLGDHGSKHGVSLWGNDDLSPDEMNAWRHAFASRSDEKPPPFLRFIHLHCFGGAALMPQDRKVPLGIGDWVKKPDGFLARYYPPNACGFASANHDEMAESLGPRDSVENNPWMKFFREKQMRPSLDDLKAFLLGKDETMHMQMLTSDYLVGDLRALFCAETGSPLGISPAATHRNQGSTLPKARSTSEGPEEACRAEASRPLDAATSEVRDHHQTYFDISSAESALTRLYIHKRFPALYERFVAAKTETERIQAAISTGELGTATRGRLKELQEGPILEFARLASAIAEGVSFKSDFYEFIRTDPAAHAYLFSPEVQRDHQPFLRAVERHPGVGLFEVEALETEASDEAQRKRKSLAVKFQELTRRFVERRLASRKDDPDISTIKVVYESIRKCEQTPVN